jgi:hypothetical protein
MNTVSRETNKPLPSGKGIPGPFSLADERVLKDALLESGFKDVATESMIVTCNFNSPQEYTRLHQAISAPIHAMLTIKKAFALTFRDILFILTGYWLFI